ncbi:MAG: hypothetical protein Q4C68_04880 [Moraxella sp.]|nr:hypothetical protein [Moraxella sp.]
MTWTEGSFYRFYTDKEINKVYENFIKEIEENLGFKHEYVEFNDEKNILFYKNKKMLNAHLEKGYHLNKNGEGCFGIESKKVSMNQIVSLHTFDKDTNFDPYDINLIFDTAYYYFLVLPESIETSIFSEKILNLFIKVLQQVKI